MISTHTVVHMCLHSNEHLCMHMHTRVRTHTHYTEVKGATLINHFNLFREIPGDSRSYTDSWVVDSTLPTTQVR